MVESRKLIPSHIVTFAICCLCVLIAAGCSVVMKDGYFAPVGGEGWEVDKSNNSSRSFGFFPIYGFTCGDNTLYAYPAQISTYTYSFGPFVLPVIPINKGEVYKTIDLQLRLIPKDASAGKSLNDLSVDKIFITDDHKKYPTRNISTKSDNKYNYAFIDVSFDAGNISTDFITMNLENVVRECVVHPIKFEKKYKTTWDSIP